MQAITLFSNSHLFFNFFAWKIKIINFKPLIFASYRGSPLVQLSKFNNFLWVCWFLCKNLSNFVYPAWKLHNPYCHSAQKGKSEAPLACALYFLLQLWCYWRAHVTGLCLIFKIQKIGQKYYLSPRLDLVPINLVPMTFHMICQELN